MESKKLIDASLLLQAFRKIFRDCSSAKSIINNMLCALATAPAVDAVEVVRCKDCKYKRYNKYHDVILCDHLNGRRHLLTPMSFCSDGERSEDLDTTTRQGS